MRYAETGDPVITLTSGPVNAYPDVLRALARTVLYDFDPATDLVLEENGRIGYRLAVAAPGFAADCLETLEELAIRGREQFLSAGGQDYAVLSCLNAGEAGMDMLEALVRRELTGWL